VTPTGGANFSPDSTNAAPGTLRLRSERDSDADGRVYLIVVQASDLSGNIGTACCTVVVQHSAQPAELAGVKAQAAAARAYCEVNHGASPLGYMAVGDGPVIGAKQ
jgi:hypothetical protein